MELLSKDVAATVSLHGFKEGLIIYSAERFTTNLEEIPSNHKEFISTFRKLLELKIFSS